MTTKEDIPELAAHFLKLQSGNLSRRFTPEAVKFLQQQSFPGNIRELRNTVVRAAASSSAHSIGIGAVREAIESAQVEASPATSGHTVTSDGASAALQDAARAWAAQALSEQRSGLIQAAASIVERELILATMELTRGNRSAAAQLLGIHRETLRDKLARIDGAGNTGR